jgi:hypothetical protein
MTDRHAGYIVTLTDDIREDDAEESVLTALRMVKGVISVEPVVADHAQHIAEERADHRWREALWDLAKNGPVGGL